MVKQPKISIIIPVYNASEYIRTCLDSVVNQTFRDIEIICIDDCSTDDSLQILEEYAKNDERFVIRRNNKNRSIGYTRNSGIKLAKGDYIMFLDCDDWLELEACKLCYKKISKNKNEFVLFAYNKFFQETGEVKKVKSMIKPFKEHIEERKIVLDDLAENFIHSSFLWCLICKRKFIHQNKIFSYPSRNFEDHLFFNDLILYAKTTSVIKKALINHRVYNESATRTYYSQDKDILNVKRLIFKHLKKVNPSKNKKIAIYAYTINNVLHWLDKYSEMFPEVHDKFYKSIRKIFDLMDESYVDENVKSRLSEENYQRYKAVINDERYDSLIKKIKKVFKNHKKDAKY